MNRPKAIATALTCLCAIIIFLWLWLTHIRMSEEVKEWPPRHDGEVTIAEEQYFEVMDASGGGAQSGEAPRTDAEPKAAPHPKTAAQPAASNRPEEAPREAEAARAKANEDIMAAFRNAGNGESKDEGGGERSGDDGSGNGGGGTGASGFGSGNATGGWKMPAYAKVSSTVTGSISVVVKIDKNGNVTDLSFRGGDAPAATNATLRAAVEREVRSKRFTRDSSPAPDEATAYITYRFR